MQAQGSQVLKISSRVASALLLRLGTWSLTAGAFGPDVFGAAVLDGPPAAAAAAAPPAPAASELFAGMAVLRR
jgi:hypothetical protein